MPKNDVDLTALLDAPEISAATITPINGKLELIISYPMHSGYMVFGKDDYDPAKKTFSVHIGYHGEKPKEGSSFNPGARKPKDEPRVHPLTTTTVSMPIDTEHVVLGEDYEIFNANLIKNGTNYILQKKWKAPGEEDWHCIEVPVILENNPVRLEDYFKHKVHDHSGTGFVLKKEELNGKRIVVGVTHIPKDGPYEYVTHFF